MIHNTAIIEEGAVIEENVTIGPFCYVGKDAHLSRGSRLESNVIIKGRTFIDEDVRIFSFTMIGEEFSEISIGKKTQIREFAQIGTQVEKADQVKKITIGSNNFILGYVQIFNGVSLGDFCIVTNAVRLYDNVVCDDRVVIGGLSIIEAGNTIGTGVMIGGASYITHDLPPFTLVEGNRATIKGLNVVGLRRRVDHPKVIDEVKLVYKEILNDIPDKELAEEIARTHKNAYVRKFAEFVAKSNI
jgi:UDP-N-acetylglucosamine acyltransferase